MIDGVVITPLQVFEDQLGAVKKMITADSPSFAGFGEIYFSSIQPGKIKAWRKHKHMVSNLAVPTGNVRVVLFDAETRKTQEVILGDQNYALLTIPSAVWSGFQGLGHRDSLIVNCASMAHDPNESERRNADDPLFPYSWPDLDS